LTNEKLCHVDHVLKINFMQEIEYLIYSYFGIFLIFCQRLNVVYGLDCYDIRLFPVNN